jgi:hypothetical protein
MLQIFKIKSVKYPIIIILIIVLCIIYRTFDPYIAGFFPQCPFHAITGLKCPGCGSQRALHCILNFDFIKAFHENALMVISIPYVCMGFIFDNTEKSTERLRKFRSILFGKTAIWIILSGIIAFWVLRNAINYF